MRVKSVEPGIGWCLVFAGGGTITAKGDSRVGLARNISCLVCCESYQHELSNQNSQDGG